MAPLAPLPGSLEAGQELLHRTQWGGGVHLTDPEGSDADPPRQPSATSRARMLPNPRYLPFPGAGGLPAWCLSWDRERGGSLGPDALLRAHLCFLVTGPGRPRVEGASQGTLLLSILVLL